MKDPQRRPRDVPVNPPGLLATQNLKDRGWTPALIARFLGEHDATRPNGLRMGRRRLPPVKLYQEARVLDVERLDAFQAAQSRAADARERAEQARQTRAARRQAQLVAAAAGYVPVIHPEPLRRGSVRKAREPYLAALSAAFERIEAEIGKLTQAEGEALEAQLREGLDRALAAAYDWYPAPGAAPRSGTDRPTEARPSDWRDWDWD